MIHERNPRIQRPFGRDVGAERRGWVQSASAAGGNVRRLRSLVRLSGDCRHGERLASDAAVVVGAEQSKNSENSACLWGALLFRRGNGCDADAFCDQRTVPAIGKESQVGRALALKPLLKQFAVSSFCGTTLR